MKESLRERPVQLARNFVADLGPSEPQMPVDIQASKSFGAGNAKAALDDVRS